MRQNNSGRVDGRRLLDQFPRIDAGAVNRAADYVMGILTGLVIAGIAGVFS